MKARRAVDVGFAFAGGFSVALVILWALIQLHKVGWVSILINLAKMGVIVYVAYLGVKHIIAAWERVKRLKPDKNAIEWEFNIVAEAYVAFVYLLVAYLLAFVVYGWGGG